MSEFEEAVSVIKENEARKSFEEKNRLARELKVEYMDFKECLDMEMSADLGENMRIQLQSVFKILKKYGVNFDK